MMAELFEWTKDLTVDVRVDGKIGGLSTSVEPRAMVLPLTFPYPVPCLWDRPIYNKGAILGQRQALEA